MRHGAVAQVNGTNGHAANGAAVFPTIEDYVGETPLVRYGDYAESSIQDNIKEVTLH